MFDTCVKRGVKHAQTKYIMHGGREGDCAIYMLHETVHMQLEQLLCLIDV